MRKFVIFDIVSIVPSLGELLNYFEKFFCYIVYIIDLWGEGPRFVLFNRARWLKDTIFTRAYYHNTISARAMLVDSDIE
jgi:hypothetical protein